MIIKNLKSFFDQKRIPIEQHFNLVHKKELKELYRNEKTFIGRREQKQGCCTRQKKKKKNA